MSKIKPGVSAPLDAEEAWAEWRDELVPLSSVPRRKPEWVLPGVLTPGLTVLAGEPRTFKTTAAMAMSHSIVKGVPMPGMEGALPPKRKGTVVCIAYEQSAGTLRNLLEEGLIHRQLEKQETALVCVKNPWEWQLASEGEMAAANRDIVRLLTELKPLLLIIDPLVHAHNEDENDPRMVRPLVPLRRAALELGVSVLLIHHYNKAYEQPRSQGKAPEAVKTHVSSSRIRGTSALWGMVDGGHLASRLGNGSILYSSDFKEFEGREWIWKPPERKVLK